MRLIVGLGNPGSQYQFTPHNLGFLVIDCLWERAGARGTGPKARPFDPLLRLRSGQARRTQGKRGGSLVAVARVAGEEVLLAKPQTYMNASGMAVWALLEEWNETPGSLVIIADDVALPWGMIRIRERGRSGGHQGLESIIGAIGTEEFCRVRVGIQPDHPVSDLAAYVLAPMRKAQLAVAAEAVERAAGAVEMILKEGMKRAMTRFNQKVSFQANPSS